MQTRTLSEANLDAEIFTAPIVAAEMRRMLDTRREAIAAIARGIAARKPERLLFFGSGGSSSALYSGYWAGLNLLDLSVDYLLSPDIVSARPPILNDRTVAIGASYSGKTVDTMAAKRLIDEAKVPLLAVTRYANAELAKGAAWSVTYESRALYSSPALLTMLLVVELARALDRWSPEVEAFERALEESPRVIEGIAAVSRQLGEEHASKLDRDHLLVLAGGAAYMLAYMMTFDMFGEYLKQYASFIHYGEFRHGPLETVRKGHPSMMFLLGNDRSRRFGEETLNFARRNGAETFVFDARELAPQAHPLLDALVLYPSQLWLLYAAACQRDLDLNHYHYMHVTPYTEGDTFF
ncbi:MAG: SIS domain-containing protein [Bryobacteraceae bacterium]